VWKGGTLEFLGVMMLVAGQSHAYLKTRTPPPELAEFPTPVPGNTQSFPDFINKRKIGQHQNCQDAKRASKSFVIAHIAAIIKLTIKRCNLMEGHSSVRQAFKASSVIRAVVFRYRS
jgi:hypothetical protein